MEGCMAFPLYGLAPGTRRLHHGSGINKCFVHACELQCSRTTLLFQDRLTKISYNHCRNPMCYAYKAFLVLYASITEHQALRKLVHTAGNA